MISTRGRYAIRVMLELAQNQNDNFKPMKEVAESQGISLKYLEQILPVLTKSKLVETSHGKGGGYKLTRTPDKYKIGEILRLTEKDLAPVACLAEGAAKCDRRKACRTISFWSGLNDVVNNYIDSVTLADLLGQNKSASKSKVQQKAVAQPKKTVAKAQPKKAEAKKTVAKKVVAKTTQKKTVSAKQKKK